MQDGIQQRRRVPMREDEGEDLRRDVSQVHTGRSLLPRCAHRECAIIRSSTCTPWTAANLLCTDGSGKGRQSLRVALTLARRLGVPVERRQGGVDEAWLACARRACLATVVHTGGWWWCSDGVDLPKARLQGPAVARNTGQRDPSCE